MLLYFIKILDNEDPKVLTQLVRSYQQTMPGRTQGENCLIELLPLPSQSIVPSAWMYSGYSSLNYCANRDVL